MFLWQLQQPSHICVKWATVGAMTIDTATISRTTFGIMISRTITLLRGARLQTGENLEVVWAEFSTLSLAVLLDNTKNAQHAKDTI